MESVDIFLNVQRLKLCFLLIFLSSFCVEEWKWIWKILQGRSFELGYLFIECVR